MFMCKRIISFLFSALRIPFLLVLIILDLQCGLVFALSINKTGNNTGTVIVKNLNFRSLPDGNSKILGKMNQGTVVKILERKDKWLKIFHNGQTGYISSQASFVRLQSVDATEQVTYKKDVCGQIENYKKKAESIGFEIKKGTLLVDRFSQKENTIINSLNETDEELNNTKQRISALTAGIQIIDKKICANTQKAEKLTQEIETGEQYALKRIVALYKLAYLGRMQVVAFSDSMFDLFQKKRALECILLYDENFLHSLKGKKSNLIQINNSLESQKITKGSIEKEFEKQVQAMIRQRAKRSMLLADIQKKKTFQLAAIESLKTAAKDLDLTIKSLKESFERPAREDLTIPSFESLKGFLNMPVTGKIISFFGPFKNKKFNVVNFQNGVDIKAKRGEPIRAVYNGRILFASWFKGYGNMIIIDHGDNYYTLYAHAEELFTASGNIVEKGEVVATVGDTGSMSGPVLHFEVRHHGKPVDPLKWIKLN